MKVLVTGGSGFIGTNMISLLVEMGFEIINYDINRPKLEAHIEFWQEVDICNKSKLSTLIQKDNPDYIIHLAARTDLNEISSLEGYNVNIEGVRNIMNEAANLTKLRRIVVASSMLVCKLGYTPVGFDDYSPDTLYGESKVHTEKIVKEYTIDWIIVRPTSIWGPWFDEPYKNFFELVIRGAYFNIPSKYSSTKTYGYVESTCKQIYSLLTCGNPSVTHNYFYLGDIEPINITDWAIRIRKLNYQSNPIILPIVVLNLAAKIGDILKYKFGIHKFPMNSFRFKNMTTDNIICDVNRTVEITKCYSNNSLDQEIVATLTWLKNSKNISM